MNQEKIYLCLAHMSGKEQDFIKEAFDTNWVVPLGPNVNGFEEDLKTFLGQQKEVVALSAGTAAIHLALIQLGVKAGDEVICQSFTFCASANPVTYLGATPVFVDSEEDTWNMSPMLLEEAIKDRIAKTGKKPKAIIPVHLYGMPAKMDEIGVIAEKYGIPVLEDAAEALGSEYNGRKCGTFGTFGALSFNGNKMITTSGGGALVCADEEAKKKTMFYATQAREPFPYYQHEEIGYNYRMSNICAGIGRGQMTVLKDHITHHRHVHTLYEKGFAGVEGIELKSNPDERFDANYWLCTILVEKEVAGFDYEELRVYLDRRGVETRPLWKPMHLQPVYSGNPCYVDGTSERLFNMGLCIPAGPCVTDEDVAYIIDEIKKFKFIKNN
ncbi:DegT/DnrJ/EryC1/StrS family aminotransferase [Bacteroides pyogenes]|uniref:DegT/DnrJ/EryC1/StrS family aminotransferase n=1 Tax=Bacteroides pyogenes TaxID=310300 RepID=UPI0003DCEFAC|nr:aminotransferase class V-fold PLP-dependent enzyme [Bacteroides pyogenes]MBB3894800.1 dTDP-4-amino-4,6-dideoxygalactose transaminase [Bacteroides pyogenes]GAE21169.1 4-keto-6-deoxy-N-Acetyl-D-hexosaminyl-aminotransferase [Bacteroides pyogenes JCM 10003]SUV35248.1 DegT/DnrJ/EryC1/StrS aminotransferase [Bacteroides pyogenes]